MAHKNFYNPGAILKNTAAISCKHTQVVYHMRILQLLDKAHSFFYSPTYYSQNYF